MKIKPFIILAAGGAVAFLGMPQAKADDIGTTTVKAGNFQSLIKALQASGLAPAMIGKTKLTVFAPTNTAFAKLPKGTLDMLLKPENKELLRKIMAYHVLPGIFMSDKVVKLPSGYNMPTVEGEKVIIRLVGGKVMLDPGMGTKATVIKTDVKADNGVIHFIDTIILPPSIQRAMIAQKAMMIKMAPKTDEAEAIEPPADGATP